MKMRSSPKSPPKLNALELPDFPILILVRLAPLALDFLTIPAGYAFAVELGTNAHVGSLTR